MVLGRRGVPVETTWRSPDHGRVIMSVAGPGSVRSGNKEYVTWSVRLTGDAADGLGEFLTANGITRAGFFEAIGRLIASLLEDASEPRGGEGQTPESVEEAPDLIAERTLGDALKAVASDARRIDWERRSRSATKTS